METTDYIQVITTTDGQQNAEAIARALVEKRLAACVQVFGPLTSTYRWKGEIQTAQEWQCVAKGRRDAFGNIEATIRRLHPYQVPEVLALPVTAGSPDYLAWVENETR